MTDRLDTSRPYFFVHVAKTAGITFTQHIRHNFAAPDRYPTPTDNDGTEYWVIAKLLAAIETHGDAIRVWQAHVPYYVSGYVPDAVTMSLVRHPVDRIVSLLNQRGVVNAALGRPVHSVEEMYDDEELNDKELREHMTKVFSLTAADGAATYVHRLPMNQNRLAAAKANLDQVEVLGCQEKFDDFLTKLRDDYGWEIGEIAARNTQPPDVDPLPASFRSRVEADNPLDMELYEYARSRIG